MEIEIDRKQFFRHSCETHKYLLTGSQRGKHFAFAKLRVNRSYEENGNSQRLEFFIEKHAPSEHEYFSIKNFILNLPEKKRPSLGLIWDDFLGRFLVRKGLSQAF